jgi:hypothetical protein
MAILTLKNGSHRNLQFSVIIAVCHSSKFEKLKESQIHSFQHDVESV